MTALQREDLEWIQVRSEIVEFLDRAPRVDLGSILKMIREVVGPGREHLVAEQVRRLTECGDVLLETGTLGSDPRGPVVAFLRRAPRSVH